MTPMNTEMGRYERYCENTTEVGKELKFKRMKQLGFPFIGLPYIHCKNKIRRV